MLDFLKNGRVQAIHFACHGQMSVAAPDTSQLILEDTPNNLRPTAVNRTEVRRGLGREHPLVFLNACEVGGVAASLSLVAGFPAAFLNAGAAAVVSPLWVVNDERAKEISEFFYNAALARPSRTLGDVMREIRARWREGRHLTYLAYVLYGDPLARIEYH
jgi:CHAT domain-containing protein